MTKTAPAPYCKLFDVKEYGQHLCIREIDHEEDKSVIKFMAQAPNIDGQEMVKVNESNKTKPKILKLMEERAKEHMRHAKEMLSFRREAAGYQAIAEHVLKAETIYNLIYDIEKIV